MKVDFWEFAYRFVDGQTLKVGRVGALGVLVEHGTLTCMDRTIPEGGVTWFPAYADALSEYRTRIHAAIAREDAGQEGAAT